MLSFDTVSIVFFCINHVVLTIALHCSRYHEDAFFFLFLGTELPQM